MTDRERKARFGESVKCFLAPSQIERLDRLVDAMNDLEVIKGHDAIYDRAAALWLSAFAIGGMPELERLYSADSPLAHERGTGAATGASA